MKKEYNTDYSYKLTEPFKVVTKVIYGSLPILGKAANVVGVI